MKITEITLNSSQSLQFHDNRIGIIEHRDCQGRNDCLNIRLETGIEMELVAAVDVGQRLEYPRVFCIEGSKDDTLLLFGGEMSYWVRTSGTIAAELALFRKWTESEYWTSKIIEHGQTTILIYEAGVLVIDQSLAIVWHKPKLLNDEFVAIEGDAIKFVRDHDLNWLMLLKDGSSCSPQ